MYKTILILALLLTAIGATAQINDAIEIRKRFGGVTFYQNGTQLKSRELKNTLKTRAEAYNIYQSSKAVTTVSTILGYTGGFMMGWSLGTALGGGKPNWAIGGVGAGLVAVSIPLSISANKKVKRAVDSYNSTGNNTRYQPRSMKIEMRPESIGLVYHF
ncbi:hypothetical protein ACTJIJ_00995 [Niabella sp. 22666]|uniref:hypothetical protein n=1 Tax=Niabella sp. 22666 TaxID=3453954 RepID=UPI003F880153